MLDLISRKSWQFARVVTAGTAVLLTGLLLKLPGFNGIPGWYWPYRNRQSLVADHTIFWIWVPLLLGIGFILLLAHLGRRVSSRPDLRITLQIMLMLIAAGLAVQVGFAVLNPRGLIQVPYAVLDPIITSYYTEALKITDLRYFLEHYTDLLSTFSLHAKTHPPGPILFFLGFNKFFENAPWATAFLATTLKETPLSLESIAAQTGLSAYQAAGLIFSSFLLPILGVATLIPLYFLARNLWDHRVGYLAAAFWIIVPSLILFTPEMDQLYALLSATSVLLALLSVRRRQGGLAFFSGLVAGVGLFFSFAFLAVIFLILLLVALFSIRATWSEFNVCLKSAAIFLFSLIGFHACLFLLSGFDILKASAGLLVHVTDQKLLLHRTYFPWVLYNLYDFFIIGLGFPFFAIFSYYLLRSWDPLIKDRANLLLWRIS